MLHYVPQLVCLSFAAGQLAYSPFLAFLQNNELKDTIKLMIILCRFITASYPFHIQVVMWCIGNIKILIIAALNNTPKSIQVFYSVVLHTVVYLSSQFSCITKPCKDFEFINFFSIARLVQTLSLPSWFKTDIQHDKGQMWFMPYPVTLVSNLAEYFVDLFLVYQTQPLMTETCWEIWECESKLHTLLFSLTAGSYVNMLWIYWLSESCKKIENFSILTSQDR